MTDDDLMRFADGEADTATIVAVTAAVAADPRVAARVEQYRAQRAFAAASFDDVLAEPVPDHLLALLRPAATVTDIMAAREKRVRRFPLSQWSALAATLVAGVAVGHLLAPPAVAPLVADARLASSLDGRPVAAIRIGFSYRDGTATYCRVFRDDRAGPTSGVACRDDDGWRLRVVAAAVPRPLGDYRTAAADLPAAVTATVDATIAGAPLDALGEAAAEQREWKR